MINWSDINSLQKRRLDLQIKLNELISSGDKSTDKINEIRSEVIYLDRQISKIVGSNEIKRMEELKSKKERKDENIKNAYFSLKNKYKKISKMKKATERMIAVIDSFQSKDVLGEEKIKVM